jgi:hypothetical protein
MADYYPLIAKAVAGLDKSTGETRRALYDRARTALLAQLRGVEPALSEPDITRERLALEEAIRKVESEVAFRPGDGRRLRAEPPGAADDGEAQDTEDVRQAVPLSAAATAARVPERWSPGGPSLSDNGLRSFREGISDAAPADDGAVRTRQVAERSDFRRYEQSPDQWTEHDADDRGAEQALPRLVSRDARPVASLLDQDDGRGRALQSFPRVVRQDQRVPAKPVRPRIAPERPHPSAWSAPRNTNRIVAIAVIGLLVAGIGGVAFWFGEDILKSINSGRETAATSVSAASGKIPERLPGAGENATAPQKVVLYEEDLSNPNGTQFAGIAVWRVERVPPAPGQKPEAVIRCDIEIPDQKVTVRMSLRRNDDKQLPASHTVEIMFKLPPDFPHGGIANIPGIMVKQGETNRGVALQGVAVKVMDNFFLIGLSSAEAEMQRNIQLLRERPWFDIPVVYADGKRAIIAVEKGSPGERAFTEAFAAWDQPQP